MSLMARSFVFFWQTEPNKFIFESARERKAQLGMNLTGEEICRGRLKEGNKKTFDWSNIEIYPIELTDWIEENPNMFTKAKDPITWAENSILRKFLKSKGYPVLANEGKEKHQGDITQAIDDLNLYLFGNTDPVDFKPKKKTSQVLLDFIDSKHENKHDFTEFLHGCTMGTGKTSDAIMACQRIREHGISNIHLVVTSKPSTRTDLCSDIAKGKQFRNVFAVVPNKALPDVQFILKERVIGFDEFERMEKDPKNNYIVSLGVQDARGDDGDKYRDFLKKFRFGGYFKDEAHTEQGQSTLYHKNVEKEIDRWLEIWLTGTPEEILLEGSLFTEQNSVLFTANDLAEAQADGDPDWQGYPFRNFMCLDYKTSQAIVVKELGLSQAQKWTLEKQWSWDKNNDCFLHENVIKLLLKIRLGVGFYQDDPRCFWGPGSVLSKEPRRTGIITISNGNTAEKTKHLKMLIEQVTEGETRAFSAHEPNGYDNWLNYCNSDSAGDSIFISHDKDMTGKNNSWINWQWISMSIASITRLGQHLGRGNRKGIGKDNVCYFFDDPDTAIAVTLDPLEAKSDQAGTSQRIAEKIHRIAAYWMEGSETWVKAEIPDITKMINLLDPIGARGLNSFRHINPNVKCPIHLIGLLNQKKVNSSINGELSDVEGDKGSNVETKEKSEKSEVDDNVKYRQNLRASIKSLVRCLVKSEGQYYTVDSILNNPVLEFERELLSLEQVAKSPLNFEELKQAFDRGDANKITVNRALSIVKDKMVDSQSSIEARIDFLSHADFVDADTKSISEPVDLVKDYMYNVCSRVGTFENKTCGDIAAGNGAFVIDAIRKGADPTLCYYNDMDPTAVTQFRKTNELFGLGVPEVNITCYNALEYKDKVDMQFDVGLGNPPYNISTVKTGNGTGGDVNLYKRISDAYPIKDGGIKALITPKGMLRHLEKDETYNVEYLNLMTEKDYWQYNTCYWIAKKESNKRSFQIADNVISKIVVVGSNPNWWELNGAPNKNKLGYKGTNPVRAVINIPSQSKGAEYDDVDPSYEKILYGPKFCATLLENQHSYYVTDDPICAKFCGAVSTKTLEEANKIKLFVENSDILKVLNQKLKTKGLFWTFRHLKGFDPNQIVTGKEIPIEWQLTDDDLRYLGVL